MYRCMCARVCNGDVCRGAVQHGGRGGAAAGGDCIRGEWPGGGEALPTVNDVEEMMVTAARHRIHVHYRERGDVT